MLPSQTPDTRTVWLAFPLIIKNDAPFTRLELVTFLEKNNIQTRPVFTGNIVKQPGFKHMSHRLAQKEYPHTEQIMRNAFIVGSHHGLRQEQIVYLCATFAEFLSLYE